MAKQCSHCGKTYGYCSHTTRNPDLRGKGPDITRRSQTVRTGLFGGQKTKKRK